MNKQTCEYITDALEKLKSADRKKAEEKIMEELLEKFTITGDVVKSDSPWVSPVEAPVIPLYDKNRFTVSTEDNDLYLDELQVLTSLLNTLSVVILSNNTIDTIEQRICQLINRKIKESEK